MIFIIFHSDDFSFKQAERQGSARVLCFRRGLNRPACMVCQLQKIKPVLPGVFAWRFKITFK